MFPTPANICMVSDEKKTCCNLLLRKCQVPGENAFYMLKSGKLGKFHSLDKVPFFPLHFSVSWMCYPLEGDVHAFKVKEQSRN